MDTLKKILSGSVPLIASVIGTASPIAGVLFSAIAHMFGLDTNATPEQLSASISADPDHDVKLRSLEIQHQDALLDAQVAIRQGAYTREAEVVKATGHTDYTISSLAFIFVGGFFIYSFLLFWVHIDTTAHDIVLLLAGQISALAIMVGNYYFGSMFKSKIPNVPPHSDIVLPPPSQTN